jgi:hypothetical protein
LLLRRRALIPSEFSSWFMQHSIQFDAEEEAHMSLDFLSISIRNCVHIGGSLIPLELLWISIWNSIQPALAEETVISLELASIAVVRSVWGNCIYPCEHAGRLYSQGGKGTLIKVP